MNCACCGEPAYWQKDNRTASGGRWYCAVTARERQRVRYYERYRDKKNARARERYDIDPIFRIEKRLHDDARRRRERIERRRAALATDTEV